MKNSDHEDVVTGECEEDECENGAAFPDALREAISRRRVTLVWLREQLRVRGYEVSVPTLSYWRSGARRPEGAKSISIIENIEILLDLDPSSLVSLLVPPVRLGKVAAPAAAWDDEMQRHVDETLAALDGDPMDGFRQLSYQTTGHIGADRNTTRAVYRLLIQATQDRLQELPTYRSFDAPTDYVIGFESILGGKMTRTYTHPSGRVTGCIIELDEELRVGETALLELTEVTSEEPSGYYASHAVTRPAKEIALWAIFHPDAVPDWCDEVVEDAAKNTTSRQPIRITNGRAHTVRHGFGPGLLRLEWGYDDDPDEPSTTQTAHSAGE